MSSTPSDCILALDLGTSSFKAAWVAPGGQVGPVTTVGYSLESQDGRVTCPPDRYLDVALQALRQVCLSAEAEGLCPTALGITSQAQTFVTMDSQGETVGPAIVWTDARAVEEASAAAHLLPDFALTSGFVRPSPLQFLPKVIHARQARRGEIDTGQFLLLNEWILQQLTGEAFGDTNNQGMGGFWDIGKGTWNERALDLAGITPQNLARVGFAGQLSALLTTQIQQITGLGPIPVYSCGNDQSCAAIGAGLTEPGDIFCNFGTAMVIYGLAAPPIALVKENQIAGAAPLPNRWFLLSDLEFGNVLEGLADDLGHRGGTIQLMEEALSKGIRLQNITPLHVHTGRIDWTNVTDGFGPADRMRAVLEYYVERFGELLTDLSQALGTPGQVFVGGGLSRCRAWLNLLEKRYDITLQPCSTEHPGLRGVARIIQETRGGACGTSV